jgi:hypothetical protein
LLLAGCTALLPRREPVDPPAFAPQRVMSSGDYGTFVTENLLAWQQCREVPECAVALLNLGFVYAYPESPYYDCAKALSYLNDLQAKYPHTPWAFEGRVWLALIKEQLALEQAQRQLEQDKLVLQQEIRELAQKNFALEDAQRRLQADLRLRETIIRNLQERHETVLRNRQGRQETVIRDLQERLKRSKDIDLELEKKTRELLR